MLIRTVPLRGGLLLLASLCGCKDPSSERGTSPPIMIEQSYIIVPVGQSNNTRMLYQKLRALTPDGKAAPLDAVIETRSRDHVTGTRAVLIRMGIDPAHIRIANVDGDVLVLTHGVASVGPCDGALQPPNTHGVDASLTSLGQCVQAKNLAAMVDHPRDLLEPVALEAADGAGAVQAIESFRESEVKPQSHPIISANGDGGFEGGQGGVIGSTAEQRNAPQSMGITNNPPVSSIPLAGTR